MQFSPLVQDRKAAYTLPVIEHIVPHNPDTRIVSRVVALLRDGGAVALPTDTSWSIVCSAHSKTGSAALKRLSSSRDERHFSLVCSGIAMAGEYCSLDNTRFRLVKRLSPGPYVFLLDALHGTTKKLDLKRGEIGVRIPDHPLARVLCEELEGPLYATTAKRSMADPSFEDGHGGSEDDAFAIPEEDLFDDAWELQDIPGLDLILDTGESRPRLLSTVLDLRPSEPECLRAGSGPWPA